jgi:uncharacterized protein
VAALATEIAAELRLAENRVRAVLKLLDEGATVPFVARYRKEMTGGLDEVQIRAIGDLGAALVEREARRETILRTIQEQGKLTEELRAKIMAASSKAELEDLYLPFKPKRRTRASIAREKGLEPLAMKILAQPRDGDPSREAEDALQGARDIAAETVSEDPSVRARVRRALFEEGLVTSAAAKGKAEERSKFEQYYRSAEPVRTIPSHRYLAIRRGESEGFLDVALEVEEQRLLPEIATLMRVDRRSPWAQQLVIAIFDGFRRLLLPSVSSDVHAELKERSDKAAVEVFAENLRNLLLAPPLGGRSVIGVDPGIRTGCKCAALDSTGKLLAHLTIFPGQGEAKTEQAKNALLELITRHTPSAIAVGNGTGGRETEAFVREVIREARSVKDLFVVSVSEAGASVYSASEIAREEFPELDLTVRGAISIGRRLQDPLAELVKIDPQAIGVGQYQHDVPPQLLAKKLDEVVESCVNQVGVELNTASAPLLARVAGIGPKLAKKIVAHREGHGRFDQRQGLLSVPGLGPRTFEQAAGFLRVRDAKNPLDASAVHPERYPLVERIARDLGIPLRALVGDVAAADRIELSRYLGEGVGEPTLLDIRAELKKPGRDPRAEWAPPRFREDLKEIGDLVPGMELEGVVSNVVAFGAFVDIGVHHDGLVHISQLSDRFVRDPNEVVKVGDRVKVRVLEVDLVRKRISLSAKTRA